MIARVTRGIAILIAIAAFIDPGITTHRSAKPVVSLIANGEAVADVQRVLRESFTLIDGPLPGAEATVVVGDGVPLSANSELPAPTFAVVNDNAPHVAIAGVDLPPRVPLDSRVRVGTTVQTTKAGGDSLIVTLFVGDAAVDRVAQSIPNDTATITLPLWFVPSSEGARHLHVTAALQRSGASAASDALIRVADKRYAVLFFDRRPSWMSTFVRRAVERDPRFVVKSRVITSRNISTTTGQPPDEFDAVSASELFDAVVVGSPDQLTDRDVAGLDAFMRRRGGGVVMLFDNTEAGKVQRLTRVAQWGGVTVDSGMALKSEEPNGETLKAVELAWPADFPAGAERMMTVPGRARDAVPRPIVWRTAVGAGRLVVSGALDAWTFRDTASSNFDAFWRHTIAEAADATPSLIGVELERSVVLPSSPVRVTANVRSAVLSADTANVGPPFIDAAIESNEGRVPFRLWHTSRRGVYSNVVRAPATTGAFTVTASDGLSRGDAPLIVAPNATVAHPLERDLLASWTTARRGRIFSRADIGDLPAALRASLSSEQRASRWHPMRSAWWIIPFAAALGFEWWSRRRRGLA